MKKISISGNHAAGENKRTDLRVKTEMMIGRDIFSREDGR
jgi:hypothetical protein